MRKDDKRRIAHEIIIFLGLMVLLFLVLRMWPLVFLFILAIFAAALRMLWLSTKKVEIIEPATPAAPKEARPETEQDVVRHAFAIMQHRITEAVAASYPAARWTWENPNALVSVSKDEPLAILLNGAGGYRKAQVKVHNLRFCGLDFAATECDTPAQAQAEEGAAREENAYAEKADDAVVQGTGEECLVNFELLAFEWVDDNIGMLNDRCNEAIAKKDDHLLIPASDLPMTESWPDITKQLLAHGFSFAMVMEKGIKVNLPQ